MRAREATEVFLRMIAISQWLHGPIRERARFARLSLTEFFVLRQVVVSRYTLTTSILARRLACTRPRITQIVRRLTELEYAFNDPDPHDPHFNAIYATDKGRDAYARAVHDLEIPTAWLSPADLDALDLILYRLSPLERARVPIE